MENRAPYAWGLLLPLAVMCGCAATAPNKTASVDRAGDLRQARIVLRQGSEFPQRGDIAPASFEPQSPGQGTYTTIEFPHPEGDADQALATVLVLSEEGTTTQRRSRWRAIGTWADRMLPGLMSDDRVATAKALSIDKSELDDLLRNMVQEGGLESSSAADAQLVIEINGARQISHPATPKSLRDFTAKVLREGWVIPPDHPHVAPRLATAEGAKDTFYQSLGSAHDSSGP